MGIAELLDEYPELSSNWKRLFRMLHLPNSCLNAYKYEDNFVIQATLILRDWCFHLKKRATVENLCAILEKEGYHHCSGMKAFLCTDNVKLMTSRCMHK